MTVLSLDEAIMRELARVRGDLRKRGQIIGDADILIAMTALHFDRVLVTRNLRHFHRIPGPKLLQRRGAGVLRQHSKPAPGNMRYWR